MSTAETRAIYAQVAKAQLELDAEYDTVTRTQLGIKCRELKRAMDSAERFRVLLTHALTPAVANGPINERECYSTGENLQAKVLVMQAKFAIYEKVFDLYVYQSSATGDEYDVDNIEGWIKDRHVTVTAEYNTALTACATEKAKVPQRPALPAAAAVGGAAPDPRPRSFKPHEGLRPTDKLPAQPTAKQVKQFIEEFAAYFKSGELEHADPQVQRAYLKLNMDEHLFNRVNGDDPKNNAAINPTELRSGFFKYLLDTCGELNEGKLTKFITLFTSRHEKTGPGGRHEPWQNMLQRVQTLATECEFYDMAHDTILALYCVAWCDDPELSKEFMKLGPPFNIQAYRKCAQRYHTMQHQLERVHALTASATPAPSTVSVNSTNATTTPGRGAPCKCCGIKTGHHKFPTCSPCDRDLRRPASERTRIPGLKCSACGLKGNHVDSVCIGRAFWPRYIDPEKGYIPRPQGGGPRDSRSARRGSDRQGSDSRNSSAGSGNRNTRRDPTPASKNFAANAVGSKVYTVPGDGPNPNVLNNRVTSVRVRFIDPSARHNPYAGCDDKTSHVTEVIVYEYVKPKHDKARRIKCIKAQARMRHQTATTTAAQGPWIPLLLPAMFALNTLLTLYFMAQAMPTTAQDTLLAAPRLLKQLIHQATAPLNDTTDAIRINVPVNTVRVSINGINRSYNPFDALKRWPGCLNKARLHQDLDDLRVMVGCSLHENANSHTRHQLAVEACADSGAAMSVVSTDIVQRLNAPITKESRLLLSLTAANDAPMRATGTARLRIFMENKWFDVDCLVTPSMTGRLLIGRPDLAAMHIIPPNFPAIIPDSAWEKLQEG